LRELNKIGVALSTEKNPDKLLDMILQKSREITSADAGSLYLVEGEEEFGKHLRFKISQNDSVPLNYEEFTIPITTESIAGYVAFTGQSLNLRDVYAISADCPYQFNRHFDDSTGYHTICTLAVPMRNHLGEIIGIIQLINKKADFNVKLGNENTGIVQPFEKSDEELISSLASQAAVALENSRLIKSIERLFEGFVTASVTAIESRDPTTSGHSFRVADLTVGLAEVVDRVEIGRFRDIRFHPDEVREMQYAALLHDFGKVGVRENVLVKAKKLYPMQLALIEQRFEYLKSAWQTELYRSKLDLALRLAREDFEREAQELDTSFRQRIDLLRAYFDSVLQSNEPTVLAEGNFERLNQIGDAQHLIPPGASGPILTPDEIRMLSIRKGSLNEQERLEIESHVTHTFIFLSKIPWTKELKEIPRIAYGHHEKLDGSGYPNKIVAEEIPVQTRIMTISDIFDALTASDRPYKRAVPPQRALDIMEQEVKRSQLDKDLFQLFVEAKIFSRTLPK
jgi:HD-GYP domain-containing protein (c-di-GMP phosphodiesterase class II)